MNRLALTVLIATAAAGLLVGCDSKTPGTATTAPGTGGGTQTNSSTPSSDSGDAPPVTGPEISLEKFKSAPCTLVPAAQLAKVGDMKSEGRPRTSPQGEAQCTWEPKASSGGVSFTATISKAGLDQYYKGKSQYNYFKAVEFSGYPAVDFDMTKGENGNCGTTVSLGKTSTLVIQVSVRGTGTPNYKTPCVESERVTAIAIEGLK